MGESEGLEAVSAFAAEAHRRATVSTIGRRSGSFLPTCASLPQLERLMQQCEGHWGSEDGIYRFYHQSFKVHALQDLTSAVVAAFQVLAPERTLNASFMAIVRDGTGKTFEPDHNRRWLEVTRPIVEAFFHARYFLETAVRYGKELREPPRQLPSGWAALLHLYDLR